MSRKVGRAKLAWSIQGTIQRAHILFVLDDFTRFFRCLGDDGRNKEEEDDPEAPKDHVGR